MASRMDRSAARGRCPVTIRDVEAQFTRTAPTVKQLAYLRQLALQVGVHDATNTWRRGAAVVLGRDFDLDWADLDKRDCGRLIDSLRRKVDTDNARIRRLTADDVRREPDLWAAGSPEHFTYAGTVYVRADLTDGLGATT